MAYSQNRCGPTIFRICNAMGLPLKENLREPDFRICYATKFSRCPLVPEGQKHRVTTPETLGKSRGPPQSPAETPQNPRRDPAEPPERPPQSPLRGKFPRRASQEGCAPRMVTLRNFRKVARSWRWQFFR